MHPYRQPYASSFDEPRSADRNIAMVATVVWLGSVARTVVALAIHESVDAEVTLAMLLVVALPITACLSRAR